MAGYWRLARWLSEQLLTLNPNVSVEGCHEYETRVRDQRKLRRSFRTARGHRRTRCQSPSKRSCTEVGSTAKCREVQGSARLLLGAVRSAVCGLSAIEGHRFAHIAGQLTHMAVRALQQTAERTPAQAITRTKEDCFSTPPALRPILMMMHVPLINGVPAGSDLRHVADD